MSGGAERISQDGPALVRVANRLQDIAREFEAAYEQMYSLLDRS